MAVLLTVLLLFFAGFVAGFILLVMGAVNFDFSNSEIPPGVNQPAKLRLIHVILISTAVVGRILENLGICTQVSFVRYMQGRKILGRDPELFIKDLWFGKVPGRILEKTGLCSQITFGRYVRQGRKLGLDPKLFIQDLQFNEVPVRVYQPKATSDGRRRGILFFHGGGWVFGSLDTYEKVCRYLSRESDSVVVSVQYRLAPEHKYPAAYEDCLNATQHFLQHLELYGVDPARVTVCGDSAGGNLAAAVSQTLAGRTANEENQNSIFQ
ncbi:hypothetical protein WISP_97148 [Willisornis vidua]|uniref:Alpha/beta hydrolase fold-3 domain-containing protein n=1 Tax=Willisornis vidua TaxID=1566151 RepID=A0ABQ9D4B0_9PASS|nr:hypothetical protein WISP_97148 [Willisornis vidua]